MSSSSSSNWYSSYSYDINKGIVRTSSNNSTSNGYYTQSSNNHYYRSTTYEFNPVRTENGCKIAGIGNYYG